MSSHLESAIKKACKQDLEKWGWTVIHLIQTNWNGIPDTLALRNKRIVFIEFKQLSEAPKKLQEYRHKKLREEGFEVIVARSKKDIAHLQ